MHPPFYTVDHKIGADIHPHAVRPPVKRGRPETLAISHVLNGWPPVPLIHPALLDPTEIVVPTGHAAIRRAQLKIVPPADNRLRTWLGRWLIRMGQRMILPN